MTQYLLDENVPFSLYKNKKNMMSRGFRKYEGVYRIGTCYSDNRPGDELFGSRELCPAGTYQD
ncbi:MAG TPA: hypothetical protein ENG66_03630 [Thermococcus sp.]|nr:hypothetical protein [Thermococcus sp.]